MDGHLFCQESEQGPVKLHKLEIGSSNCSLAKTDGAHAHGPGCGHERVPHDDHHDWLVSYKIYMVIVAYHLRMGVPQPELSLE